MDSLFKVAAWKLEGLISHYQQNTLNQHLSIETGIHRGTILVCGHFRAAVWCLKRVLQSCLVPGIKSAPMLLIEIDPSSSRCFSDGHLALNLVFTTIFSWINYTTVDPKQFVFFNIETRAWAKDCARQRRPQQPRAGRQM